MSFFAAKAEYASKNYIFESIQCPQYVQMQSLHTYVVACFLTNHHLKIGAYWALILFWINHPYSEIFKMVFYAIVARLEPAQSRIQAVVISRFSVF